MTNYEAGFLSKCASCGVPEEVAIEMLKTAEGSFSIDGATGVTVQPGDTVEGLAVSNGYRRADVPAILAENGLTEETARKIKPGQEIYFRPSPEDYRPDPTNAPAATSVAVPPPPPTTRRKTMTDEERQRRLIEMQRENLMRRPGTPENLLGMFAPDRYATNEVYNVSTNSASR